MWEYYFLIWLKFKLGLSVCQIFRLVISEFSVLFLKNGEQAHRLQKETIHVTNDVDLTQCHSYDALAPWASVYYGIATQLLCGNYQSLHCAMLQLCYWIGLLQLSCMKKTQNTVMTYSSQSAQNTAITCILILFCVPQWLSSHFTRDIRNDLSKKFMAMTRHIRAALLFTLGKYYIRWCF